MNRRRVTDTEELDLGHRFSTPALLRLALTHASHARVQGESEDNERLEFLGDAVLGLRVSERLSTAFPHSGEGELTRQRAAIVSAVHLAAVARRLNLGAHLRLSPAEEAIGGRDKPRLLANALEAVIAALYLDGGYTPAAAFIDQHVIGEPIARFAPGQMAEFGRKSALQEWAHAHHLPTPRYRLLTSTGPEHAKQFTAEVLVGDQLRAEGTGLSRKSAEQAAAGAAMAQLDLDGAR